MFAGHILVKVFQKRLKIHWVIPWNFQLQQNNTGVIRQLILEPIRRSSVENNDGKLTTNGQVLESRYYISFNAILPSKSKMIYNLSTQTSSSSGEEFEELKLEYENDNLKNQTPDSTIPPDNLFATW